MIRKFAIFACLLLVAGCAQQRTAQPLVTAPGVPLPPPPPRGEPELYTGVSGDRLRVMLGNPAFIRKDGATEMWRYDTKTCRAFFFLYGAGTQAAVRHVETAPQGRNAAADPVCLAALNPKKIS